MAGTTRQDNTPLPCIVCGRKLESAMPDDIGAVNQPYGGTAFKTYGHYGSTVFDAMDFRFLEIAVCDPCLVQAAADKVVLIGETRENPVTSYEEWNPDTQIEEGL